MQETRVRSLGLEDPLKEESVLAWEIPWTEKPGGLQSRERQRVGYNGVTKQTSHQPQVEAMFERQK